MVEFDTWRERYAAMSFDDQVRFHSRLWESFPSQRHFDLACVDEFFAAITDPDLHVLEIGGWTGDVASHVIDNDPRVCEWLNVELCKEALISPALRHPEYDAVVQGDFIWNQPQDFFDQYNVLVMSHSIEHMDNRDVAALAPNLNCMKWMYIDTPLPASYRPSWAGYTGTHKLDMSWDELREFWEARGWEVIGQRVNEQEDSLARWFRRVDA